MVSHRLSLQFSATLFGNPVVWGIRVGRLRPAPLPSAWRSPSLSKPGAWEMDAELLASHTTAQHTGIKVQAYVFPSGPRSGCAASSGMTPPTPGSSSPSHGRGTGWRCQISSAPLAFRSLPAPEVVGKVLRSRATDASSVLGLTTASKSTPGEGAWQAQGAPVGTNLRAQGGNWLRMPETFSLGVEGRHCHVRWQWHALAEAWRELPRAPRTRRLRRALPLGLCRN